MLKWHIAAVRQVANLFLKIFLKGEIMNKAIAAIFVLVTVGAASLVYLVTDSRPLVTPIEYGDTPANMKDGTGHKIILPNKLPPEKYNHQYYYLLVSNEGAKLDGQQYLKNFPEDTVIKKSGGRGTGEEYLRILTDHLPDPASKERACRERAKWLKLRPQVIR